MKPGLVIFVLIYGNFIHEAWARKNAERQKIPIHTKIAFLAVLDYGASFLCANKKSIKYFRF